MAEVARRRSRRRTVRRDPIGASPPVQSPDASHSSQLDAVIHERARLGIVSALAAAERLSFAELKAVLKTTDGNVSAHTRRLEAAGYIVAHKRFEGRVPRTEYELTEPGRKALEGYLSQMEALIRTARRR